MSSPGHDCPAPHPSSCIRGLPGCMNILIPGSPTFRSSESPRPPESIDAVMAPSRAPPHLGREHCTRGRDSLPAAHLEWTFPARRPAPGGGASHTHTHPVRAPLLHPRKPASALTCSADTPAFPAVPPPLLPARPLPSAIFATRGFRRRAPPTDDTSGRPAPDVVLRGDSLVLLLCPASSGRRITESPPLPALQAAAAAPVASCKLRQLLPM